jgi:ubiquinone/menaquinone biosynthesis C-methylase UbiE
LTSKFFWIVVLQQRQDFCFRCRRVFRALEGAGASTLGSVLIYVLIATIGIVGRVPKERLGDAGNVVGIDVSADMLAVARAVAPNIDWREGNATALPLNDGEQFDVVVCQQGLQFFPDKAGAVTEMRRALSDRGRLAIATWRSDDEIPFFRAMRKVAERHLGAIVDQRYSFGDEIDT